MTQYEVLKLSGKLIEQLEAVGVRPSDHKYLRLFEDWAKRSREAKKLLMWSLVWPTNTE
jgi:hypothetical protein